MGFLVYTLKTSDKVMRYGENNQVEFSEHPTVVNGVMNVQLIFWYLLPMLHSWTSKVGEIYERKEESFVCG